VGSGNLHNIAGATVVPAPRSSSSNADKSLHASGVKASMRASRASPVLVAGRAASLLARNRCADGHHGPLAQLVRAHG
jgi:hypothetical protein